MIDSRVPTRSLAWSGTGTVLVDFPIVCCMIMWLPRCRTRTKLCGARIRHTSRRERTWSLGKPDAEPSHVHLRVEALFDFRPARRFEEQLERFFQVLPGFFDGVTLACDVELGAQRHVAVAFALDNRREVPAVGHVALSPGF